MLGEYRKTSTINLAQNIGAKRIIAPFSLKLIFKKHFDLMLYHQYHAHREVWRSVALVRHINKAHFDSHIAKLDMRDITLHTPQKHNERIEAFFAPYRDFRLRVGINAFGNGLYKFAPMDFVHLARHLAKKFPSVLFIMMNFSDNAITFRHLSEPNIIVFDNDSDVLNLVAFMRNLDLLITPDTGNVHIADILRLPILEHIQASVVRKWGGGSCGNPCHMLKLKKDWFKHYHKLIAQFHQMAESMISALLKG